jgi:hypothetical protein
VIAPVLSVLAETTRPDPTPWWATPLVAGAFALLGVAIAQLITLTLERRRNKREDARRLDAALRPAALAYLDALQSYATFVTSLTIGNLLITGKPSIVGVEDEFTLWSKHSHEISDAQAQLSLAARGELLTLAGEVHEPMHRFNIAAQQGPMTAELKYTHAEEVYDLIPRFRNAVRVHLGLDGLPVRKSGFAKHAIASERRRREPS